MTAATQSDHITQVTAAVRNPARPKKLWEGLFLVDTGAVDCMVPGKHLRALGLKPRGNRIYELADGSEVALITRPGTLPRCCRQDACCMRASGPRRAGYGGSPTSRAVMLSWRS